MTLGDFTEPKLLVPRLLSNDQCGAIRELAKRLLNSGRIDDAGAFAQAALEREQIVGATPEYGVAFPHARGRGVINLCFAVGLSGKGISWGTSRGALAHTVFLLAVPLSETQRYLTLLSDLARFGQDEGLRSSLAACGQSEEMWAVLNSA
jgi:mannitol/fructose-specific phosphotransferase system IIA component (Ntr-type)